MDNSAFGNAMTEIALALAMAFFSLMVLTLVSMGAGDAQTETAQNVESLAAQLMPRPEQAPEAAIVTVTSDDTFLIFHQGQFLDSDLNPTSVNGRTFEGRVVLAIDPALPLKDALAARAELNAENLVVSTLDDRWLQTLAKTAN